MPDPFCGNEGGGGGGYGGDQSGCFMCAGDNSSSYWAQEGLDFFGTDWFDISGNNCFGSSGLEQEALYLADINTPTIQYYFEQKAATPYQSQAQLAAITVGQLYAAQNGITDPDNIADIISQIYGSLTPASTIPGGGNYNFLNTFSVNGVQIDVTSFGCSFSRCGTLDSLDYSHVMNMGTVDDTDYEPVWHIDTANVFDVPVGSLLHFFVDIIGGNT